MLLQMKFVMLNMMKLSVFGFLQKSVLLDMPYKIGLKYGPIWKPGHCGWLVGLKMTWIIDFSSKKCCPKSVPGNCKSAWAVYLKEF